MYETATKRTTQCPIDVFTDRTDEKVLNTDLDDEVSIDPAPDAAACGAAGCRENVRLLKTRIEDFGQRVLCASHAAELIRREVLDR